MSTENTAASTETDSAPRWYGMTADEALAITGTDPRAGLASDAIEAARAAGGPNELPEPPRRPRILIYLAQFNDVMIWLLLAAAAISAWGGDLIDAAVIGVILLINAGLGYAQEVRAEAAIEGLKQMSAPRATVVRDGVKQMVPSREIVTGDLIVLAAGDIVPADVRLIEAPDLEVDESGLTGESLGVPKHVEPVTGDYVGLGDRVNMAHLGSTIQRGRGTGVVVATGVRTEMGRIAAVAGAPNPTTPLQDELKRVGGVIAIVVVLASAGVFVTGWMAGRPLDFMFLAAVSLAVSAVPEALTAVVTISLGVGVRRMAAQNAIVRRLHSVETLGATDVIATDKTGTLTRNRMAVVALHTHSGQIEASDLDADSPQWALDIMRAATLANDAEVREGHTIGDPTETALIEIAQTAGIEKCDLEEALPRVAEVGFTSDRKMMTTLHADGPGFTAYTKGAPEVVLERCAIDPAEKARVLQVVIDLASDGLRTLAVAERRFDEAPGDLAAAETGLTFLGILGLADPPRAEVPAAIRTAQSAGIRVIMVTGDHEVTARAIAHQVGLPDTGAVLGGRDVDRMSDEELAEALETTTVIARVDPLHKMRVVEALRSRGHVVAVTGDGVNDAPALKTADVGVAMGITGTEVAKDASDMVLADDNFATIVAAVREGRVVFDNLTKFVHFLLSANVSQVLLMFLVTVVGLPVPLFPVHLLWTNLMTDSLPALALGVDPEEKGIMLRRPRGPKDSLVSRPAIIGMVGRGTVLMLGTVGVFLGVLIARGVPLMSASDPRWAEAVLFAQTATFTALVLQKLLFALTFRSHTRSIMSAESFKNPLLLWAIGAGAVLQLAVVYIPGAGTIFRTVPLGLTEWAIMLPAMIVPVIIIDVWKVIAGRRDPASAL
ncbi:MAG: cation-transporting P-type ATPase [Coriobacteriia bacterium]|nr:cation-transporting P-type ATPase [Coriobacteriia bacterium]